VPIGQESLYTLPPTLDFEGNVVTISVGYGNPKMDRCDCVEFNEKLMTFFFNLND